MAMGMTAALALSLSDARAADKAAKEEGGCSGHGTSVQFFDTPSEAARKAKKDEKLVFVLHISGNFEDPRET
jgi:hypothetical protein